eukprot:TRINITY_DN46786_c0_g1_i1.p1 TRINITY_DN46786_c0_g1~~TRINITY_DN46786_c0_g1_i1.p1  ORF type:complete len:2191 (+),score=777.10 TRINITY_DN46786_c0_g1_i1:982-6573(+)
MPFDVYGLHALRLTRALPHLLVPQIRSVRAIFESFRKSSSLLIDNISILLFFVLFFGVCAVEFFAGGLAYQCVLSDHAAQVSGLRNGSSSPTQWAVSDGYIRLTCSPGQHSVFSSKGCPEDMSCVDVGNPEPDWLHFDNLGAAALVIFQVIQLENWSALMFPLYRSRDIFFAFVFFLVMIVACRFIIINLFFAIIVLYFDQTRKAMDETDPDSADAVGKYTEVQSECVRAILSCLPSRIRLPLQGAVNGLLHDPLRVGSPNVNGTMLEAPITPLADTGGARSGGEIVCAVESADAEEEDAGEQDMSRGEMLWQIYEIFAQVVVVANVGIQATERADQSQSHEDFLDVSEYCFLGWYCVEQLVRLVLQPGEFLTSLSYWFDLAVFVLSVPAAFGAGSLTFVTRMRVFRLLLFSDRVQAFALRFHWEPVLSVLYMIVMIILVFAAIGMQLFSGLYAARFHADVEWMEEEWRSAFHFETLGSAMLTLFLVMAGDNWSLPMYQAMGSNSMFVPALIYFLAFFILSNWVLLSMFVAVLLDEFDRVVGGSLLERNVENHELISRSRELFSQFLRRVDMGAAADNVDEESVAGVCAVVNMHKWATRAKSEKAKKMRYIAKKEKLEERDIAASAAILGGARLAKTLETLRERIGGNCTSQQTVVKGADRLSLATRAVRMRKAEELIRKAEVAQRAVENNVSKEQSTLKAWLGREDTSRKDKDVLKLLLSGAEGRRGLRPTLFAPPEKDDASDAGSELSIVDSRPPSARKQTRANHILGAPKLKSKPGFTLSGLLGLKKQSQEITQGTPKSPRSPARADRPAPQNGEVEVEMSRQQTEEAAPPPPGAADAEEEERYQEVVSGVAPCSPADDEEQVRSALQHFADGTLRKTGTQAVRRRRLPLQKRLKARSLFVFDEDHPVRQRAVQLCETVLFNRAVLLAVVVSSFLLIFSNPAEAWGDESMRSLDSTTVALSKGFEEAMDIIFLVVFTLEFLIKVVAYGFVWMSYRTLVGQVRRRTPAPYIRNPWNLLDFCILVVMYVSFFLQHLGGGGSGFAAVRVFRVLRVIRVLRRVESLRRILSALLAKETLKSTLLVLLLALFFYVSFGLIAVNLLGGKLSSCTDSSMQTHGTCNTGDGYSDVHLIAVDDVSTYVDPERYSWASGAPTELLHLPSEPGYLAPKVWRTTRRNYDSLGSAIVSLITIASGEDWGSPMLEAVKAQGWKMAAFFLVFMVLMSFVVINMVIFVITGAIRAQSGTANMVPEQIEWSDLMHHIRVLRPLPWIPPPGVDAGGKLTTYGRLRHQLLRIAGPKYMQPKPWFDGFINAVIIVNIILMGTEIREEQMSETHRAILTVANYVIALIYLTECVIRLIALTPKAYFRDRWNCFDFVIVVGSVVSIASVTSTSGFATSEQQSSKVGATAKLFSVIRIFRILRIFKLIRRFKGVAFLFSSLLSSIPAISNIMLVVVLFIWVWGALGTELFGQVRFQSSISPQVNFRSFFRACETLTMVITLDDWINIFFESQLDPPECSERPPQWVGAADGGRDLDLSLGFNDCGRPQIAVVYFISFFVLGAYIFLNLVTAAILDEVQHTISREQCRVSELELEEFQLMWMNIVQGNSREMPRWRLQHLMEAMFFRNKLGLHPCYHKKFYTTFVLKLDWHKLQILARKGGKAKDVHGSGQMTGDDVSTMWPPPTWPSFRFHEVLHILCHNSYENVPLSAEDVTATEAFQRKADRLLATQVLQSVIRTLATIHQIETGRHPGIRREGRFTRDDCSRLKQVRNRIRAWKSAIKKSRDAAEGFTGTDQAHAEPSPELLERLRAPPHPVPERVLRGINPTPGFSRLYRLPRVLKVVVEEDMKTNASVAERRVTGYDF